jgi:GNAT superfamily N-acetyltransferase
MLCIRRAVRSDVPQILRFIRGLAEYERLAGACVASEESLAETLFGARAYAEVLIADWNAEPAGFALFFHSYSTFLARPGIFLEDLFVEPDRRGNGIGKGLLAELARIAVERGCGRLEWSVLDWNETAIGFYKALGAVPMEEWTGFRLTGPALERVASLRR